MGLSERSDYVLDCLNGLYAEARDNMNGYLSGEKEYKVTYKYVTSKIDTDGEMVYADMKNTQTGEITRRPMIGTGYGNFWQYISKDLPIFSDIGASVAQIEIGPDSFLVAPGTITNWSKIGGYPATFEIVKDEKYSGEASLHIISTQESQPGNWVYYSQRYSVKPNTTYTYGLAAKANNPEGGGGVWFSVNAWAGTRQTITGTHDWQTYEYQYTTGPEETELEFYILCENVNECWIDDVFVRELGSDENLLQNSGFEFGAGFENRDGILINPSGADDIIATLQSAEDNNVTVSLLISPHYMPGFILDESEENKSRGTHFINFNVESARIRQALDIYLSELLPKIKDYKSLNSICLLNEPLIWSSEDEFFIQGFREYLKEIYGDIAELNKNYGSDFASFDEITFEYVKGTNQLWNNFSADLSKAGKTPVYYDYQKFNNEVIAEFYGFLRDTAKKYAPDLPVSFKSLNQTFDYDSDYIRTIWRGGGDLNLIKDITDYNGCDAHAYVDAADGNHIMTKERWYDYLTSVKDAPVFNMEDHIIRDGNTDYIPEQELWWTSNAWQMALHGGTMNASWVWARTFNTADALYGSVLERPDVIAGYGKTALDMNRLAYEIEAIVKKTADVAVLDSIPSRAASNAFQSAQNNAWKGSVLSGQETDHITEAQIEEGKLSEYKLLIVPCAARVLESTLDAINTFLDNGGKVIIVGEESLKLDEYGHEHDAAKLESVFSRCDVYPAVSYNVNVVDPDAAKMRDIIWEALEELGLNKVEIVDSNTGELVSNVEWNYAMCDGKLIVSLINYDWGTEKDISVIVNGEKIETFRELREDKEYNASYTLSYYKPVMFSIDASI